MSELVAGMRKWQAEMTRTAEALAGHFQTPDIAEVIEGNVKIAIALELGANEIERLEKLVMVPGVWRCAKCEFVLIQSNLNGQDGTVTARDEPGSKCPNDGSPMWRVSYRDYMADAEKNWDAFLTRKDDRIAELTAALQPFADKADKWEANHGDFGPRASDSMQVQHRLADFRTARTVRNKQ